MEGGITMNNYARLSFASLTYAMQARDLFVPRGIGANIIRLNSTDAAKGCSFGLELQRRDLPTAVSLLTKADIEYRVI